MEAASRTVVLLALSIPDSALGRRGGVGFMEDSGAFITSVRAGRNPALRRVARAHGVSGAWLIDVFLCLESWPTWRRGYQDTRVRANIVSLDRNAQFQVAAAEPHRAAMRLRDA